MDLLDRLLGHDAWTTRQLLLRCQALTDTELDRAFDIGHRTVRATFQHVVRNMEVWADLIAGGPVRPDAGVEPAGRSVEGLLRRLEAAALDLGAAARRIAREGRWDERWIDPLDCPPTEKSYGGAITHVLTHSMHHRAQLLYLLRRLGLPNLIEGDVISWESRPLASVRPGCYTRAVPRAVAPAPPSGAQDAEMRSSAAGVRGEAPMASVVLLAFGALACGLLAVGLIGVAIRYRKEEWLKSYKLGLTIAVLLLAGSAEWCFTQALKKAEAVDRGQGPAPAPEPAKP